MRQNLWQCSHTQQKCNFLMRGQLVGMYIHKSMAQVYLLHTIGGQHVTKSEQENP
jgi:hypothetical protein